MHFSIPETEECYDNDTNSTFSLYKIHINSAHHCSVRFSQLHNLNEQLKIEFDSLVPTFPPKKLFGLSEKEKEERRSLLEKFLQQLSQIPKIMSSDLFVNFFLNAQKETQKEPELNVDLSVYLMNSERITVSIKSYDQTEEVLEKLMAKLKLNPNFIYYFGIYVVKKDTDNSIQIVRELQEFESPHISLKAANKLEKHRLLLRKCFEAELYDDGTAINLLYIQAIEELSNGWIEIENSKIKKQLQELQEKNLKLEFLKLISSQKFYGYLHFKECITDYPESDTKVKIALGNKTIHFRTYTKSVENLNEIIFKVTRIRCWKVSGINKLVNGKLQTNLEISFEYMFSKQDLRWITIQSEQSILISMSLQNVVDEILLRKAGKTIKRLSDRQKYKVTPFLTRQKAIINASVANENNNDLYVSKESNNDLFEDDNFISNDDL